MDFQFLAQADAVALELEKAKRALEKAKSELENAKLAYDELLAKADDLGIPRGKLKKITEDRIQSLMESGLLEKAEAAKASAPRPPRRPKTAAKSEAEVSEAEFEDHAPASEPAAAEVDISP